MSSDTRTDYKVAEHYIDAVEAFARTTAHLVLIIDLKKRGFLFVSENPILLCGETAHDVVKMGFEFYRKYIPLEDINRLSPINIAAFDFLHQTEVTHRRDYTLSYDFHLVSKNYKPLLVTQKITPLALGSDKNVWLAPGVVSISAAKKPGIVSIIKTRGKKEKHIYNFKLAKWELVPF